MTLGSAMFAQFRIKVIKKNNDISESDMIDVSISASSARQLEILRWRWRHHVEVHQLGFCISEQTRTHGMHQAIVILK